VVSAVISAPRQARSDKWFPTAIYRIERGNSYQINLKICFC